MVSTLDMGFRVMVLSQEIVLGGLRVWDLWFRTEGLGDSVQRDLGKGIFGTGGLKDIGQVTAHLQSAAFESFTGLADLSFTGLGLWVWGIRA